MPRKFWRFPRSRPPARLPISLTGVVTAAEPGWGGRFFVQDASSGVFVNNTDGVEPAPGDLVAVSGASMPGGYAPCVDKPHWKKIGTAPLPNAKVPTIEEFIAGSEDSQRIEMSGIVRSAFTNVNRLGIQFWSPAPTASVLTRRFPRDWILKRSSARAYG